MKVNGFVFLSLFVMSSCGAMNDAEHGVESAMQKVEVNGLAALMRQFSDELSSLEDRCDLLGQRALRQEQKSRNNALRHQQEFDSIEAHRTVRFICGE